MPILVQTVKESGLLLATFGEMNFDMNSIITQKQAGVDAIITDWVFKYNVAQ